MSRNPPKKVVQTRITIPGSRYLGLGEVIPPKIKIPKLIRTQAMMASVKWRFLLRSNFPMGNDLAFLSSFVARL